MLRSCYPSCCFLCGQAYPQQLLIEFCCVNSDRVCYNCVFNNYYFSPRLQCLTCFKNIGENYLLIRSFILSQQQIHRPQVERESHWRSNPINRVCNATPYHNQRPFYSEEEEYFEEDEEHLNEMEIQYYEGHGQRHGSRNRQYFQQYPSASRQYLEDPFRTIQNCEGFPSSTNKHRFEYQIEEGELKEGNFSDVSEQSQSISPTFGGNFEFFPKKQALMPVNFAQKQKPFNSPLAKTRRSKSLDLKSISGTSCYQI